MVAADEHSDLQEHGGPTVFVSYAHDDAEHRRMVLELAQFLTRKGIWVDLDVWSTEKRRDWAAWASTRMSKADYVLVIASARYRLASTGDSIEDAHRGARYEAGILRELLYGDPRTWRRRVLPVVLPGHALSDLPVFLQPHTNSHFIVPAIDDAGLDELLRVLIGQPRDQRPPLGKLTRLADRLPDGGPDELRQRLDRLVSVLAEAEANEREARGWPSAGRPDILGAPPVTDRARDLRVRVIILQRAAEIDQHDPRLLDPLRARESDVADALRLARDVRDRRAALWAEWDQTRRELRTYKAQALATWSNDKELAQLCDSARNCLWRDPCDLGAAGIAVANYGDAIRRRRGIA
jgi:hypothetical protein